MNGNRNSDARDVSPLAAASKIFLAEFMSLIVILCLGITLSASGGTRVWAAAEAEYYFVYQSIYPMEILRSDDSTSDTRSAYCINRGVLLSGGEAGTHVPLIKLAAANAEDFSAHAGDGSGFIRIDADGKAEPRSASDAYDHIMTVLSNGYPEDRSGLLQGLERYKGKTRGGRDVYEFDASLVTQAAIWHFTDAGHYEVDKYRYYTLQEHIDVMNPDVWTSLTPSEQRIMQEIYDRLTAEDGSGLEKPGGRWSAELDIYRNASEPSPMHGRWQNLAAVRTFESPDEPVTPEEPETVEEPEQPQEEEPEQTEEEEPLPEAEEQPAEAETAEGSPAVEETSSEKTVSHEEAVPVVKYVPPRTDDQSGIPLYAGLFAAAGSALAAIAAAGMRRR